MPSLHALIDAQLQKTPLLLQIVEQIQQHINHITDLPLPDGAALGEKLTILFIASDFAATLCATHPQWLQSLIERSEQLPSFAITHHQRLAQLLEPVTDHNQLMQALRHYRNRELLRIIYLDANRIHSTEETVRDLSNMADACIDAALSWLYNDACEQYGTPYGSDLPDAEEVQQFMVVLGMGKLGGQELNLSSDIDLMFAYPCQGETRGAKRSLSNQEFFIRLGQRLIKTLDSNTCDGFVFRVDMRLRPYGNSGALAMSFAAMEQYYQDQGRDWERYAMLKARPVAGHKTYGIALLARLRPFTYRRYLDFGAISALREMKQLILKEVNRRGMEQNIKLGEGGIREIEFIVQSFQLIHGGRDRSLQQRHLLTALDKLFAHHYISCEMLDELRAAYCFLRDLEHALQGMNDKQTQQLPINPLEQARIASVMQQPDWQSLCTTLDVHRKVVSGYFADVVAPPSNDEPEDDEPVWESLWQSRLSEDEELALISEGHFQDPQKICKSITALRDSKAMSRTRRQSRERIDRFMPQLLAAANRSEDPDTFVLRTIPLVEAVLRRTAYLVLLMENPQALDHLGKLCIASPWIADLIARFPVLLDEFLNMGTLYQPPDRAALADELRQQLAHIPQEDLENQMEALRHFKMSHVLRIVAAQVSCTLPLMKESDYLTWLAEVILEATMNIAWRTLAEKYGEPRGDSSGFAIIGYGKLGGIELGPGSDLDLVFLHNGDNQRETTGPQVIDSTTFYTRLGQRIIHILSTQTSSGILYEVDMRLRPSGAKGLLVSSFAYFEKYQLQEAWTWEHQALVRARVICGDQQLAEQFQRVRAKALSLHRDPFKLMDDVVSMRAKMSEHLGSNKRQSSLFNLKHDRGGIVDIEFLMQFAVLNYARQHPELLRWTDNIRICEQLEQLGILTPQEAYQLTEAYKSFRLCLHQRTLQNQGYAVEPTGLETLIEGVQQVWQRFLSSDV